MPKPTLTKTETVTYDDGKVVQIKRVTRANLPILQELLQKILNMLVIEADMWFGELVTKEEFWSVVEAICGIVPIVNSDSTLDHKKLSDNWEEVMRVFITEKDPDETGALTQLSPSMLGRFHLLNFTRMANTALDSFGKTLQQTETPDQNTTSLQELTPLTPTPTST